MPLQPEATVSDCMIENDARLYLVGRKLKDEQPEVWENVEFSVTMIHKLLRGERGNISEILIGGLFVFLKCTLESESDISEEDLTSRLNIFRYLFAPPLVMLYVSQPQSNKELAESLIRKFISSCSIGLSSVCALVVLEFCNVLRRSGAQDGPLYTFCRSTLGLMVENQSIGTSPTSLDNMRRVILLKDVFPCFSELTDKLVDGSRINLSPNEVRDLAVFFRPIKATVKDIAGVDGSTPITMKYANSCTHKEVSLLHEVFIKLLQKMRKCLEVVKDDMGMTQKEDGEWGQYLIIMKEVHGIAQMYQHSVDKFWSDIQSVSVPVRYLVVTYAMRGEDYEWMIEHKDLLDFESRRHLVTLMLPQMNGDDGMIDYVINIDRTKFFLNSFNHILNAQPEDLRGGLHIVY